MIGLHVEHDNQASSASRFSFLCFCRRTLSFSLIIDDSRVGRSSKQPVIIIFVNPTGVDMRDGWFMVNLCLEKKKWVDC